MRDDDDLGWSPESDDPVAAQRAENLRHEARLWRLVMLQAAVVAIYALVFIAGFFVRPSATSGAAPTATTGAAR